jgi:hypothetical protein
VIKQFGTRLNVLEKQYSPKKKRLLLIARDENETLQEAFDRTGKPRSREDYKVLFVVGVSVKG